MLDSLFRLALIVFIIMGTYGLYGSLNFTSSFEVPEPPIDKVLHALFPEIIFVLVSWFCFLLLINMRLGLLIGFMGGQTTLYFLTETVTIQGYKFPVYVLIAINCLYLLMIYFYFASERWASGSLEGVSDEYTSSR